MKLHRFLTLSFSAGLLLSTALLPLTAEARGGGGGFGGGCGRAGGWGGAGAGGRSWGGGSYHFQNNDFQRGYQGNHPMYG